MNCPLSGNPCNKPKVYHITDIEDGEANQLHLCQSCAEDYLNDENISK